jgi:crotonobetainyl-CoA:carnitine CoA-transferase CaiB-like acyl-CoA transferase
VSGGALDGLSVVEVGHGVAGAFAARLLGDLGADVVKVERPGRGDFVRRLAPLTPDGRSAVFEYVNWNKRSVALELTSTAGRAALGTLAERADVLLDSLAPGRLDALGLGPASLREHNPRLVITSVSDFGGSGPYAGWKGCDLVFAAMSGLAQISGSAEREPLKRGLRQSYYCAGISAAYASLAGHLAALRTGAGAHVDLAIRECPASELVLNESHYICTGAIQGRRPALRDPLGGPLGGGDPLPATGGHIALQVTPTVPVERLAELRDQRGSRRRGRRAGRTSLGVLGGP